MTGPRAVAPRPPGIDLRTHILEADDREERLVEVPEWSSSVLVRSLTGDDRAKIEALSRRPEAERPSGAEYEAHILVASVHDPETKQRLFSDTDVPLLMQRSGAVLQRLAKIAGDVSGIEELADEEAVAVAAGN